MIYTKKRFGSELKAKIVTGSSPEEISKWAYKVYTDHGIDLEDGLDCFVLKLVAMEEGPEFSLSRDELFLLAKELACISKD